MVTTETGTLKQSFENINSISANIKANNERIQNIISNVSLITDSLTESTLATTLGNTEVAISELKQILERVNQGEGSLGKLATSDSLYLNLEAATKNLEILLEDIKTNPKRYVNFSVFGGRKNK